ncbi:MAG: HEAT repeat domain-containing protein, partial [Anaerolineae bacterium]|nr:HEAT repeat domain-containing protein [Anaerolineae bacterium]
MTTFNDLAEMLLSDDISVRNQAIYAIGEAHADHPLAAEALARLLHDESKVATHAATLRALGKLGGERALNAITH